MNHLGRAVDLVHVENHAIACLGDVRAGRLARRAGRDVLRARSAKTANGLSPVGLKVDPR
jgi:hypothetical protein